MSAHAPSAHDPGAHGRPLRVLDVVGTLDPAAGGIAEGVRQIALQQRAAGHCHEVLTLDAPRAPWLQGFPVPVHALGPTSLGTYAYTPALRPWLQARAPAYDAVVVQGLWQYPGLAVRRALAGSGVPYYVFPHGMLDPWFRRAYPAKHLKKWLYWPWAEYRVLRDARAVLFTAEEEALLAPQSFTLYRARARVVGYGIAPEAGDAAVGAEPFWRAFPSLRGSRVLLFMGRLHPKKGCDLLIDAFAAHASAHPGLRLVLAGPDAVGWRATLERRAAALRVDDRVCFAGMLAGTLKQSALQAAEALVLPSHQENFGVVVAEALAAGLPVLLSRRVNVWREVVQAGAGLADDDDLPGTTALLAQWLALPRSGQHAMRARARPCFDANFHVAAVARRLSAVLRGDPPPTSGSLHGCATNDRQTARSVT